MRPTYESWEAVMKALEQVQAAGLQMPERPCRHYCNKSVSPHVVAVHEADLETCVAVQLLVERGIFPCGECYEKRMD